MRTLHKGKSVCLQSLRLDWFGSAVAIVMGIPEMTGLFLFILCGKPRVCFSEPVVSELVF